MNFKNYAVLLSLTLSGGALAQTYQAMVYPDNTLVNGISSSIGGGHWGGKAALFDGFGKPQIVHPKFLDSATTTGTSYINGRSGELSVGYGISAQNPGHTVALRWVGKYSFKLDNPFPAWGAVAVSTDGNQIVGTVIDITTGQESVGPGDQHGIIWDAQTGAVIADLYDGKPQYITGGARGIQVGYDFASNGAQAMMWRGTARPAIDLHPNAYDVSQAVATDGVTQVGNVGIAVRLFDETHHGTRVMMNSAAVWHGKASSLQTLGYYLPGYPHFVSFATGVSGPFVCGVGQAKNYAGTTQTTHAVVWDLYRYQPIDLHLTLPTGYISSRATSVDAAGNVTGYTVDVLGRVHGVIWTRN